MDRRDVLNQFATGSCSAIAVSSDKEATEKVAKEVAAKNNGSLTFSFVFSQMMELSEFQARRSAHVQADYLAKYEEKNIKAGTAFVPENVAGDLKEEENLISLEGEKPSDQGIEQEDFSEAANDAILSRIDGYIGKIGSSLPMNSVLMVITGNGDAFECRRAQEIKMKRQGRVYDYLPPWNLKEEEDYSELINREIMGLCLCEVSKGLPARANKLPGE